MTRGRLAAVSLLCVLGLWLILRDASAPEVGDVSRPAPSSQTAPADGRTPLLVPRGGGEPAAARAEKSPRDEPMLTESGPGVAGRVLSPRGPVAGAEVYVVRPAADSMDEARYELLARGFSNGEGEFALALPAENGGQAVSVGALAAGWQRDVKAVNLHVADMTSVDLTLQEGGQIAGVVRDVSGAPVSDLELFVSSTPYITTAGRTDKYFRYHSLRHAQPGSSYFETRCRSDVRGGFRATGLGEAEYTVRTTNPAWFITQTGSRIPVGSQGVELTAVRAMSLRLTVVEASTGTSVGTFAGGMVVSRGGVNDYQMPLAGEAGQPTTLVTWPSLRNGAEFRDGFDLHVTIRAPGFEAFETELRFDDANGWVQDCRAELRRLELGVLRVRAVDGLGRPVSIPLVATLVASPDPNGRPNYSMEPHVALRPTDTPGTHVMNAGVGDWWATVRPEGQFGPVLAWRGRVSVAADGASGTADVVIPDHGSLRVVVRGDDLADREPAPQLFLRRLTQPGVSSSIKLVGPETTVSPFPPGRWKADLGRGEVEWSGEFEVVIGEETTVEITR